MNDFIGINQGKTLPDDIAIRETFLDGVAMSTWSL